MNKKLIKILGITSCVLGGGLSISSLSTSCSKPGDVTPTRDFKPIPVSAYEKIFTVEGSQINGYTSDANKVITQDYADCNAIVIPNFIGDVTDFTNTIQVTSIDTYMFSSSKDGDGGVLHGIQNIDTIVFPQGIECAFKYVSFSSKIIIKVEFQSPQDITFTEPKIFGTESYVDTIYYNIDSEDQLEKCFKDNTAFTQAGKLAAGPKKIICTGKMKSVDLCAWLKENADLPADWVGANE